MSDRRGLRSIDGGDGRRQLERLERDLSDPTRPTSTVAWLLGLEHRIHRIEARVRALEGTVLLLTIALLVALVLGWR